MRPSSGTAGAEAALPTNINHLPTTVLHHIFGFLDPRDLIATSATCRAWAELLGDAASNEQWRRLFLLRWALPAAPLSLQPGSTKKGKPGRGSTARTARGPEESGGWRYAYSTKLASLSFWDGPCQGDPLNGHRAAVRAAKLCPGLNLAVTGSADRTVKLWDLSAGMPLATSLLHGGTVRSVAVDGSLLVSGSSDATVRYWRAWPDAPPGRCPFVLTAEQPAKLAGKKAHTGPVTSLELTEQHLFSGSWDMTVRCWRRGGEDEALKSVSVWGYRDFVWEVALRGPRLLVAAGRDLFVQDAATGQLLTTVDGVFGGTCAALEGLHSGQIAFTGGSNGQLLMHDLRMPGRREGCALLWQGPANTTITSLSLEDPWMAFGGTDGVAGLLDLADVVTMGSRSLFLGKQRLGSLPKQKVLGGGMQPIHAVHIQDRWVACGTEETAKTWQCGVAGRGAGFRRPARGRKVQPSRGSSGSSRRGQAGAPRPLPLHRGSGLTLMAPGHPQQHSDSPGLPVTGSQMPRGQRGGTGGGQQSAPSTRAVRISKAQAQKPRAPLQSSVPAPPRPLSKAEGDGGEHHPSSRMESWTIVRPQRRVGGGRGHSAGHGPSVP